MKLIIIGAGPGGYETALLAAERGVDVTLIESSRPGGTCLNEGCIPTKAFCRSAEILEEMKVAPAFGVSPEMSAGFDFVTAAARKNAVVGQLREGLSSMLSRPGIRLVHGKASFVDRHTVAVIPLQDGNSGARYYEADYIIVATGSVPAILPVPGAGLEGVVTSRELLDIDHVPERLCIIGAGVIGLEFASIFRSFGSEVTVVEYCSEILPRFDKDIAKRLRQSLAKRGIAFFMGTQVQGISEVHEGHSDSGQGPSGHDLVGKRSLSVAFVRKGAEERVEADTVLMAVGRRPAVDSLNLDEIGVEYDAKGIKVNGFMQTNIPDVYAVGDITGGYMLAHAATMQGVKALDHIMGIEDGIDLSVMPAAVFTMPEAASVGLTEEDCKAAGIVYSCRKSFFRSNGKALCLGEADGMCKIITDSDGRLLGCHMFGPHASDLIHEATAFITMKARLQDMRSMVHVHPSLSEIFR
ncbi:MAG: dihydrolipoyl dehydrogenase [Bacteroidetes bacterium]|uniref:Dihydrolipoyl dehydrogenase n=1 Tax=Candidatus Cryptobacteroides merdavium TaxID=2840769 RepID=A0A9D9EDI6_9BACT|nr:dihydrolipoyl dehydrogenase [Candidatus Cryptobacteroides merdavium]